MSDRELGSFVVGAAALALGVVVMVGACYCTPSGFCRDEVIVLDDGVGSNRQAACWSRATLSVEIVEGKMLARCTCPRDGGLK